MIEQINKKTDIKNHSLMIGSLKKNDAKRERIKEIHSYIDKNINRRQSNKVLHSHPSPLLWKECNIPIKEIMEKRKKELAKIPKRLNLYVATPYCVRTDPPACGFCLFPHEVYTGTKALHKYLDCLKIEGSMYQDFFSEDQVAAIYFGGGTPNIYKVDTYNKLMGIVGEVFPNIPTNIEITLEGLPQLFTKEKLICMKELGINRISMGVQQINDELIKLSGRPQTSRQVFQVLEWCDELGLRTSIDLIYGWPRQTMDLMLKDLESIVSTGITHITHYELNVAGRSDFARRKDELPSIEQNRQMFHAAKQFLESCGYRLVTTYDWEKVETEKTTNLKFEDNMRQPFHFSEAHGITGTDMWGWGYGGVSFFAGLSESLGCAFMNSTKVNDYFDIIDKGQYPIERGYMYEIEDIRLGHLFQSLQNLEVNLLSYKNIFGVNLLEEYEPIWHVLQERRWIEITSQKIMLIGDGIYFTPLIQALLSSKRNEDIRRKLKIQN